MKPEVQVSYDYCRRVALRSRSNFVTAFYLLPRRKRLAMYALYAFTRFADDAGDGEGAVTRRRSQIKSLRRALDAALDGVNCSGMFPALVDAVQRYDIPRECLFEVLDGVEGDLEAVRFRTWDELSHYCRQVAGVVGTSCVHIWGFRDAVATEAAAQAAGRAFQLTNILRDVAEDAARDRLYLPEQELEQFSYTFDELRQGMNNDRWLALLEFQIARARAEYAAAEPLFELLSPTGRRIYRAMSGVYQTLLDEIERSRGEVLTRRLSVGRVQKMKIFANSILPRRATPRSAAAGPDS